MKSRDTTEQAEQPAVRDGLATVDQACEFLQVSRTTLYKMMESGFPAKRLPGLRAVRIPWAALREFCQ